MYIQKCSWLNTADQKEKSDSNNTLPKKGRCSTYRHYTNNKQLYWEREGKKDPEL